MVPSWTISNLIKCYLGMIVGLEDFTILHFFREGNKSVDHLANSAVKWWRGRENFPKNMCNLARNDVKIFGLFNEINDDRL